MTIKKKTKGKKITVIYKRFKVESGILNENIGWSKGALKR